MTRYEYEAGSLITIDHNVTWRHIPLSYEYSHTRAFYPELVNNEHALAPSKTIQGQFIQKSLISKNMVNLLYFVVF